MIIPKPGRAEVLQELHEAHPGATRMKRLARMFVWWPGMDQDIEEKVKSCPECQSHRPSPPLAPLQPWQWPSRPWSRLHLDFAGPFMGHMFLVVIDSHSKWMEVHLMPSITSAATIQHLRAIFAQFGLSEQVVTDNGPSFISAEFKEFLRKNGVKHTTSAPYHPASNGLAERAVKTFKQGVRKMKNGTLQTKVARFLFSYRITPQSTTGISPAELLMGRKLRSPLDLMKPDLNHRVEKEQERQKAAHDQHSTVRTFKVGDAVYARNFGPGPKWLPAGIVEVTGPLSCKVKLLDGKVWRRHQDHLRKRYVSDSQTQVSNSSNISSTEPLTDHSPMFPLEFPTRHSPDATSRNSTPSNETSTPDSNTIQSPRYPQRNRQPPDRYC